MLDSKLKFTKILFQTIMFDSAVSLRQKEDNAAQLTISSASNVLDSQSLSARLPHRKRARRKVRSKKHHEGLGISQRLAESKRSQALVTEGM